LIRRPLSILLVVSVALVAAAPADAAKTPRAAKRALKTLTKQTAKLPGRSAAKRTRAKLLAQARAARRAARRAPCKSVRVLNRFRRRLAHTRVRRDKAGARLAALGPASMRATQALLTDKRTRRCGGGLKPSRLRAATAKVLESTDRKLRVRLQLPDLRFAPATGGGRSWTKLVLPDTDQPQQPGKPGIPVVSRTFAVPEGATVLVDTRSKQSLTFNGVEVFPAQADPVDQDTAPPDFRKPPFIDPPFAIDGRAYDSGRPFPSDNGDGAVIGHARDLQIGNVQIPAARWTPSTGRLEVIRSIEVVISFGGNNSRRFPAQLGSPWERLAQRSALSLLNRKLVFDRARIYEILRRCGEELLIITNPATRPAADTLRNARSAAGIRSRVVETGGGAGQIGTTAAAIQAFVRAELTRIGCVRPSYVAIMGDDDLVPTFAGVNGIPSDLQYSMRDDLDELPDLAVGRVLGNDLGEVQTAVEKIVTYETTPPAAGRMQAMIAAQFQDDNADGQENRTFIQFAERVATGLEGRGVAVDRIYGEHPGNDPQKFNDGTDLPASLKKPAFAWDGDGADVTAAWNAGRFLAIHRDHGYSDGWGTPGYATANVDALTNGANLPVLMSINCSSAAFDYDETSFVSRALVNPNGGAVGAFGDTRDSPTWHNTQIGLGFVDALLPSILPAEGPATRQRVGDALINGKLRLAGLAPPGTDGSTRNELYLWHYFGDPTMQMWGGTRKVLDPSTFAINLEYAVLADPGPDPPYHVVIAGLEEINGQQVSLLRDGEVVGKATVVGGGADLRPTFGPRDVPKPGQLRVALEPDGGLPQSFPVSTPKATPVLTQACPESTGYNENFTISGTLAGPPAGSQVVVTATAPDTGRQESHTVTTDSNGDWSTEFDPPDPNNEDGLWSVSSHYAGNDQHTAADGGPCTFESASG
jgi:hypothetical protein